MFLHKNNYLLLFLFSSFINAQNVYSAYGVGDMLLSNNASVIGTGSVGLMPSFQRNISLSNRLMDDFYKRMKHRGVDIITVGFYVEKFFFRQGFEINKQYGGLVKRLN